MKYLFLFSYLLIIIGIILFIISLIKVHKKKVKLVKHKDTKYAILIPARDESKVIEKLLKSIQVQNKNMSNVYVIVEDKKDKTCTIARKYHANVYVRKKPIKRRKGYALDECIKEILKYTHYDLYFIFDADNVLDSNFISNMLESFSSGYDVAIGYRNILNPINVVSGCSGLMFLLENSLGNENRLKANEAILLSGTGFYISGEIIEKLGGFPFNTLTEDYELSLYISSNNISSTYNPNAIFYDEQPIDMKSSIKQRTRWVKGFFEARRKRKEDVKTDLFHMLGISHLLFIIFGVFALFIVSLINVLLYNKSFVTMLLCPILFYLALFLLTLLVFIKERKNINLDRSLKIKCLFFNPIFLSTFVICFFKAILKKEVKWDKIKHNG